MKNSGRERLVVLGAGWAAYRIIRDIDINKCDLTVVSPRFLFFLFIYLLLLLLLCVHRIICDIDSNKYDLTVVCPL